MMLAGDSAAGLVGQWPVRDSAVTLVAAVSSVG